MRRPEAAELSETLFDVVIIGGGITGTATARDAAMRGLSVLLVEKDDFAAGTSSRSSKLIHGGLRYLQTYQFKLVAESLRERERMLTLAPHLTEMRPFLYLLYRGYPQGRRLLDLGLTFYDAASGQWRKRRHRMLSAAEVLEREPYLASEGLLGAGQFYDVLTDDSRVTIDTAKGAAEAGAVLMNHATVTELLLEEGHARGVRVHDRIADRSIDIHSRLVLNATGPWTERTRALENPSSAVGSMRPTKGVHIVLKKRDFPLSTAVFLRSPDDGRVVWPTPSLEDDVVYIGTTDTDFDGNPDDVAPTEADITYLLNVANRTIPSAGVTESHIVGSWAGVRPLVAPSPGTTAGNTSREHAIATGPTGMITISGGKFTSSRLMAAQLIDAAESALGREQRRGLLSRVTSNVNGSAATTPISGGGPLDAGALRKRALAQGVPPEVITSWLRRYGTNTGVLIDIWGSEPESRTVLGPRWLTIAEIRYGVEHEMVRGLADLLVRRVPLFYWDEFGGLTSIEQVADELAALLNWTPQERADQIVQYRALVQQHRPHPLPDSLTP